MAWGWTPIAGGLASLRLRLADRPRCRVARRYARSHGKVTFPAATSRREKMRCDLFTGSSMTAQAARTWVSRRIGSMGHPEKPARSQRRSSGCCRQAELFAPSISWTAGAGGAPRELTSQAYQGPPIGGQCLGLHV